MANPKPFLTLNASIEENRELDENVALDVQLNRIEFEFPAGFATIPLIEECRALNKLDDFDLMYDITMQLLTEKPVFVYLKDYNGKRHEVANFIVTDKMMDLRGIDFINKYPIVVNWLVGFVARFLSKKYPRPSIDSLPAKAAKRTKGTE